MIDTQNNDPLPSWQDGQNKQAILDFVQRTIDPQSAFYVPPANRIAVFDHDGTLWLEKPHLTEMEFLKDLLKRQPRSTRCDTEQLQNNGVGLMVKRRFRQLRCRIALLMQTIMADSRWLLRECMEGVSADQYKSWAATWLSEAKHPRFNRHYTELVYQPMLEVMQLFSAHDFRNYIVSGGSNYFVRAVCEPCYQIPAEQAIGSQLLTKLVDHQGQLQVELRPLPWFLDNGAGKVLAIENRIDIIPIAAFGNTSGDIKMLRWASISPRALCMFVHHTDAEREYQYSLSDKVLAAVKQYGWQLIDMKKDWIHIFPEPTAPNKVDENKAC